MSEVLRGKVALVTGASRGIGAAIAERLAADGADVAITYARSPDRAQQVIKAIQAKDRRAVALHADAADAKAAAAVVPQTVERLGRLDILVNNAGIFFTKPIEDSTEDEYERMMNTNVRGVFLTAREATRVMGPGGRIINIGSIAGESVPFPGMAVYAASKFAVAGFTRAWARELAGRQITVNCVQPGPIDTEVLPPDPQFRQQLIQMVPAGRLGRATEVADLVAMLAAPSSSFITGATLNVDGGVTA